MVLRTHLAVLNFCIMHLGLTKAVFRRKLHLADQTRFIAGISVSRSPNEVNQCLPSCLACSCITSMVSSCSGAPWASSAWSVPRSWPHAVGASLTPPRTFRQTARQYLHCCRPSVHGLCCCWQHGLHFRHLWASPPVDHVSVYLLR